MYILHLTPWRSCAISKRLKIFLTSENLTLNCLDETCASEKILRWNLLTSLKSSQFLFFLNDKLVDNLTSSKCLENSFKTHFYWLKVTFLIYIYIWYILNLWLAKYSPHEVVRSAPLQCLNLFWRCNCVRFDFPSHLLTP